MGESKYFDMLKAKTLEDRLAALRDECDRLAGESMSLSNRLDDLSRVISDSLWRVRHPEEAKVQDEQEQEARRQRAERRAANASDDDIPF